MKKSLVIKLAGVTAAAVAIVGVSGCSIIGSVANVARNAAAEARGNVQAVREEVSAAMDEARYGRETERDAARAIRDEAHADAPETAREAVAGVEKPARGLVEGIAQEVSDWMPEESIVRYAEAVEGYGRGGVVRTAEGATAVSEWASTGGRYMQDDSLKKYEPYGIEQDKATQEWYFGAKPIAGFRDPNSLTFTNGSLKGIGVYLAVERDANQNITGLREVDKAEFCKMANMSDMTTVEQDAASWGAKAYKENITVKGMTEDQLYKTERELMAKYRGQDALVQCNDYAFTFGKNDVMSLSSFCSSDMSRFGVRMYANPKIADEIDINRLDSAEINNLLLDMLKTGNYTSAEQVDAAAKTLIANHYGISEANLIADVAKLD